MADEQTDQELESFERFVADLEAGRIKTPPSRQDEIRAHIEANLTSRAREARGLPSVPTAVETAPGSAGTGAPAITTPASTALAPLTPAAASAGSSIGLGAHYRFPDKDALFSVTLEKAAGTPDDVLFHMVERVSELRSAGGAMKSYLTIRPVFCALSVELNRRQAFAPRIRVTRKLKPLPKGAKPTPEGQLLSNDRQVIDLHWLYCTNTVKPKARWGEIFDAKAFQFERASAFVAQVGKTEDKVKALGLPRRAQAELAVIQSREVYDCWRDARDRQADVEVAINEALSNPRSRLTAGEGIEPMLSRAYVALRLAKGSPSAAAELMNAYRWATDADAEKLSACKRWLKTAKLLGT